jgi:hypothetical protein
MSAYAIQYADIYFKKFLKCYFFSLTLFDFNQINMCQQYDSQTSSLLLLGTTISICQSSEPNQRLKACLHVQIQNGAAKFSSDFEN